MYNLMTCGGFSSEFMGGCSFGWMGAVLLFFIIAIARKYLFEELMQTDFNFIAGEAVGILSYMIAISFLGAPKWCVLIGMACGLAAGYFASAIMGGGDSGGGSNEF